MEKDIIVKRSSAHKFENGDNCRLDCYNWWLYFDNIRIGSLQDYSESEIFIILQLMNYVASVTEG